MVISNKPSNNISIMKGASFPIKLTVPEEIVFQSLDHKSKRSILKLTVKEAKKIKKELDWALKKLEEE
jgi:hypothetical protein